MTETHKAEALPEGERRSDTCKPKPPRLIASKEIPGSISVYVTHKGGADFTLYSDSLWLGDWALGHGEVTMPFLYRHARQQLRKPISFHCPTLDLALDLVDELPNEIRFGRLAVLWDDGEMPEAPPNPDQDLIDWMAEFEAEIDELTELTGDKLKG